MPMKILYAVQGTGNGHVSRACDVIPELKKYAQVDILISGYQADLQLPFDVTYKLYGMSFIFGKHGGVDIWQTIKRAKIFRFLRDIKRIPVESYDLVINDFEPITAWACKRKKIPCISVSHQSAVLNPHVPKPPKTDLLGKFVLKYYAPTTKQYGIHFKSYDTNMFTPVIRKDVRNTAPVKNGHYTVYLPAYDDRLLLDIFTQLPEVNWHVFSKHMKIKAVFGNVTIFPVSHKEFGESLITSSGVFCGAGFETLAEALFLGKKLMVIPMKNQFEQQCNAAALKDMGVPVLYSLSEKSIDKISQWIIFGSAISVDYPDVIPPMIEKVIQENLIQNI